MGSIEEKGKYRYALNRRWGPGPPLLWVMLNPSTADHDEDDPTIRRVRGFSERLGFQAFIVANLYAARATKPARLLEMDDPIGPRNDSWLQRLFDRHPIAIAAWGAWPNAHGRSDHVEAMARARRCILLSFGETKGGAPRHPLYLRGDAPLIGYSPSERQPLLEEGRE